MVNLPEGSDGSVTKAFGVRKMCVNLRKSVLKQVGSFMITYIMKQKTFGEDARAKQSAR